MASAADLAAHARLLADKSLQLDFPPAPLPPATPEWLKALIRLLDAGAPMFKWVIWIVLGGVACVLLFFVVRELIQVRWRRRDKARPTAAPLWAPDRAQALRLLADADALAAAGDYDGATHVLLFRSIDEIDQRRSGVVRPALTSRDIAALSALPPAARPAFGLIAQAVEKSFFGGSPLGAEDFRRCRQAYSDFALGEVWS